MSTSIYYFSGTGNCLSMARKLSNSLDDCRIIPIKEVVNIRKECKEEKIGFVFPTYAYGLPVIVRRLLKNMRFSRDTYFFAVASNCGIPGTILYQVDNLLKKQHCRLNAGFAVLDMRSSLIDDPKDLVQRLMISVNHGRKPKPSSERIDEIVHIVNMKSNHPIESSGKITNLFGTALYNMAIGTFKSSSKYFWTLDTCTSCGTCVRVCPNRNIIHVDCKPVWGKNCEMCHACIQWCPKAAIQFKNITQGKVRYRNIDVSIKDMTH